MINKETTKKEKVSALIYILVVLIIAVALTFAFKLSQLSFINDFVIGIFNAGRILLQVIIYILLTLICFIALIIERHLQNQNNLEFQNTKIGKQSYLAILGLKKENLWRQIFIALIFAFVLSAVVCLITILGFNLFTITEFTAAQIIYNFINSILIIGISEEVLFRGYVFSKLEDIFSNKHIIILICGLLFGIWHIINGSWIQVISTTIIGIAFGYARTIAGDSLLSSIIAHGIYDAMLPIMGLILFLIV